MTAYYNEIDPFAAAWLRELIKRKLIAPGVVDERSIEDVAKNDLRGFNQCHFFAGIGVWSYALRLAGWPDSRSVWTGSCPCQPFSVAGKRKGTADDRHLWPDWFKLIDQCRPDTIFGEQVASKDGITWLDTVSADLEGAGYTVGAVVLPACGVGAPHRRERLFFVADSNRRQRHWVTSGEGGERDGTPTGWQQSNGESRSSSEVGMQKQGGKSGFWSDAEWIYCRDGKHRPVEPGAFPLAHGAPARVGRLRGYGNAINAEAAAEFIQAYIRCRMESGYGG